MFSDNTPLKPGDLLTYTYDLEQHLHDLGYSVEVEYGDELVVLEIDLDRDYAVAITDPRSMTWVAWVYYTVAQLARQFWLHQMELLPENEGVSSLLPLEYWNKNFRALSQAGRIRLWNKLRGDPLAVWKIQQGNFEELLKSEDDN